MPVVSGELVSGKARTLLPPPGWGTGAGAGREGKNPRFCKHCNYSLPGGYVGPLGFSKGQVPSLKGFH